MIRQHEIRHTFLRCNNKQKTVLSACEHFIVVFVLCIKANLEAHFFMVYLSRAEHLVSLFHQHIAASEMLHFVFCSGSFLVFLGGVFYVSGSAEGDGLNLCFSVSISSSEKKFLLKGAGVRCFFFCIGAAAKLSE